MNILNKIENMALAALAAVTPLTFCVFYLTAAFYFFIKFLGGF